jgi:hypothetical protein
MIRFLKALTPKSALMLVAVSYLVGMFALKLQHAHEIRQQLTGQWSELAMRVVAAERLDTGRKAFVRSLKDDERLHGRGSPDDLVRGLRTAITQALPGVSLDIAADQPQPLLSTTGAALLPVTAVLRIDDETLPDTLRIIEELRPGFVITRLFARRNEPRRALPPGTASQLELTLSGMLLIEAASGAVRK